MEWWQLLIGGIALAGLVDAAMSALERRGLVYWRHHKSSGSGGALGGMAGELMNAFQPTRAVQVEEQRFQRIRVDQAEVGGSAPPIDLDAGRATLPGHADGRPTA